MLTDRPLRAYIGFEPSDDRARQAGRVGTYRYYSGCVDSGCVVSLTENAVYFGEISNCEVGNVGVFGRAVA